ncbi:MDR family NADP-dependent oxidoreductase [Amycolatopsis sp. CA-230715]|uniref:MDR family NADP-dependent oxidoreductase n=1 Tax=Amycolatopsis sp. CA-230715 TaxID=2745196 RepID=UPI001C031155|nr:NADP-dependent oxidoreductase [Amycolatopsis sp. CA-230715]QWF78074.1 NADPH-dependent curcumin reductase [Amycolatopsis sp. CA-230715]
MNASRTGLALKLVSRPSKLPTPANFELTRVPVPDPAPGQLLVRTELMSLDPLMLRLAAGAPGLPMPVYELGEIPYGEAIGRVVESAADGFSPGDLVRHRFGWREFAVAEAASLTRLHETAVTSTHLGFGVVAQIGLDLAKVRPGDTVFVSSAAGAVGGVAGQVARLLGATRVIGSAGSAAKVRHVRETLGFGAAFDYHDGAVADHLREAAPDGIDVYFDNVGGEQLRAAIEVLKPHGRIVLCGSLAGQTGDEDGRVDPFPLLAKRITVTGFTLRDHSDKAGELSARLQRWVRDGAVTITENIVDGLVNAPQALADLANGAYFGKVLVRLAG